ncbi:hypothetical protein [Pseudonocardia zijingensis]|jgi:hypothetical protein|uniref:Uncharacterized protein n=1 Tax=Pseudonocardia zijingensis TaxID=153376 RepID=A0ABP3YPK9_9PSEU
MGSTGVVIGPGLAVAGVLAVAVVLELVVRGRLRRPVTEAA